MAHDTFVSISTAQESSIVSKAGSPTAESRSATILPQRCTGIP